MTQVKKICEGLIVLTENTSWLLSENHKLSPVTLLINYQIRASLIIPLVKILKIKLMIMVFILFVSPL